MAERSWTAEKCFEKAAEVLLELGDELKAAKGGYEQRGTAAEWRRLGMAIRGDSISRLDDRNVETD